MKLISSIVGVVLLSASIALAYLANTNAQKVMASKNLIVEKYVKNSTDALATQDIKGAVKFAKLAIAADPKNKAGFKALEAVYEVKYKPAENNDEESVEEPTKDDSPSKEAPAAEEEEEETDMGC